MDRETKQKVKGGPRRPLGRQPVTAAALRPLGILVRTREQIWHRLRLPAAATHSAYTALIEGIEIASSVIAPEDQEESSNRQRNRKPYRALLR